MERAVMMVSALETRAKAIEDWLVGGASERLADHQHLDHESRESAYWHAGYHRALAEMLPLLTTLAAQPRTQHTANPFPVAAPGAENCRSA